MFKRNLPLGAQKSNTDVGIAVSYCFVLHFCAPNGKFVFSTCLLLSIFTPPDDTQVTTRKVTVSGEVRLPPKKLFLQS